MAAIPRRPAKLLKNAAPSLNPTSIAWALANAPEAIYEAARRRDQARALVEARLVEVSKDALSTPLFPGKTEADPLRLPSNDKERDLAIDYAGQHDPDLPGWKAQLEAAQRGLDLARDRQLNYRLIAQLLLGGVK